jgi:hypothetical protein
MLKIIISLITLVMFSSCNYNSDKNQKSHKIITSNGYQIYFDSLNNLKAIKHPNIKDSLVITFSDDIKVYSFKNSLEEKIYFIDKTSGLYKIKNINCLDTNNCFEQISRIDTTSRLFVIKGRSQFISSVNIPDSVDSGKSIIVSHHLQDSILPSFKLDVSNSDIPFQTNKNSIKKSRKFFNTKGVLDTICFTKKGYNYYNGCIINYKILPDSSIGLIEYFFNYKIFVR